MRGERVSAIVADAAAAGFMFRAVGRDFRTAAEAEGHAADYMAMNVNCIRVAIFMVGPAGVLPCKLWDVTPTYTLRG